MKNIIKRIELLFNITIILFNILILIKIFSFYLSPYIIKEDDKIYYYKNRYVENVARNGWFKYKNNWYFVDENYVLKKNQIIEMDDKKYYVDEDGKMINNVKIKIDDKNYFANEKGELEVIE